MGNCSFFGNDLLIKFLISAYSFNFLSTATALSLIINTSKFRVGQFCILKIICNFFQKYSIKFDIPDMIQKITVAIRAILQPIEISATKIKVYKANILTIKQMIFITAFAFICLSIHCCLLKY